MAKSGFSGKALIAAVALVALPALAGCAEGLDTSVTRFSAALPPPAGQSFAIVADDPANNGGIEFNQYAADVAAHLVRLGYAQAPSPDAASMIVHLGYGVDKGHQEIDGGFAGDPYFGPWRGYRGWGWGFGGGWGGWGGGWGGGCFPDGGWGYGWCNSWVDTSIVYTSGVSLRIDSRAGAQRLFEGKAEAASTSNRLPYLVPNLIDAMFTGFPGNSGQTMRITVAPEKKH